MYVSYSLPSPRGLTASRRGTMVCPLCGDAKLESRGSTAQHQKSKRCRAFIRSHTGLDDLTRIRFKSAPSRVLLRSAEETKEEKERRRKRNWTGPPGDEPSPKKPNAPGPPGAGGSQGMAA